MTERVWLQEQHRTSPTAAALSPMQQQMLDGGGRTTLLKTSYMERPVQAMGQVQKQPVRGESKVTDRVRERPDGT